MHEPVTISTLIIKPVKIKWVLQSPVNYRYWSYTRTLSINGDIEMFGPQESLSSPTDPLFRQLSQDCPIRGLTMQTQRLLLACNLQASKREWRKERRVWEDRDTGCQLWSESWMPTIKDMSTPMQIHLKTLFTVCVRRWFTLANLVYFIKEAK